VKRRSSILVLLLEFFFFFNLLFADSFVPLKLNILALLLHVKVNHPVELLLIILTIASDQKTLSSCSCGSRTIIIVGLGLIIISTSHATNWADTYILIQEVLVSEVIEEGCQVDHWAIFFIDSLIIIVDNVLLDLLDNSIGYSLKHNGHRLSPFTLSSNIFLELLVNLLGDPASPPNNLIVDKLYTLVQILSLLTLLLQPSDLVIENL
jgi:hypothetical protein